MRRFWMAAACALGLWGAAMAQSGDDQAGPRGVIEAQIAAFLADDFDAAFAFASPAIRGIFVTPERFGQMVVQGYPMVHRPAALRFLEAGERGGAIVQRVLVTDAGGRLHVLEYEMIRADDGFLINGVRILPPAGAGA